jgi:uncharacterized protein
MISSAINRVGNGSIDWNNFTPVSSILGGALIGLSSSIFLISSGRITGISGLLKVATTLKSDGKRQKDHGLKLSFIAGLTLTGTIASMFGLYSMPASADTTQLLTGGMMVGAGASLQHGCTSGHGVCGLSRKSPKSLVLVSAFLAAGILTATVLESVLAPVGLDSGSLSIQHDDTWSTIAKWLFPIVSIGGLLRTFFHDMHAPATPAIGAVSGGLFGAGLILSGMAQPSKVVGFLDIGDNWDPSLMLVMLSAILVSLAPFSWAQSKGKHNSANAKTTADSPYLFPGEKFSTMKYLQPSSWSEHSEKARSLCGAVLFGAGWAISGMCPGPGLILGGAGSTNAIIYIPAVLIGQRLTNYF